MKIITIDYSLREGVASEGVGTLFNVHIFTVTVEISGEKKSIYVAVPGELDEELHPDVVATMLRALAKKVSFL